MTQTDARDGATLVTGAGRGIGKGIALEFASHGESLVVADVDLDNAKAVAARCQDEFGVRASAVAVDVTRTDQVRAMVQLAVSEYGRIRTVVNCAGVFPFAPALDTTDETWDLVIGVNLTGTFLVCREAARSMVETGGGSIVNISSGAGSMANPNLVAYSASKAGVLGLSRCLAAELAPAVRVNVVSPGPTRTEGTARAGAPLDTSRIPMRRTGEVEEIAQAVRFLASDEAGFITGQTLHVNGGKFMP
ncbi:SDR family NAD(P)-dependent oxidoreductase [Nonomuraea wenchangensis]|uniref:3-oxoacyl-[acyl-carrier protein] reductase/2-hydroxycyclohexanecarboxyl-CoA dehydrogenase n=1 Tax=Nonomuraea wenchangensis TaxID=568860 RepID=A0A1I0LBC8_9ACTN|nr:SDR family NAD(P)-dependent oxidoreductase [Nonomuraea wenchangensis]SEU37450.1 3-oxoacyl-[acyl-carrier protein] reductase/2-hydroxycyclohexanecarboxyl-CoA dehydrogenase [Nonomuraea wenchangensis]